ncbi:MAG: DNA adenine methylase [bacterium]
MNEIKSPIYYTGNKYRLLSELKDYIPAKINTFIDLFGGSGVMAINFSQRSKKVIYNELNTNIYNLFNYLIKTPFKDVNNFILKIIKDFSLEETKDLVSHKQCFYALRDYINKNGYNKDPKWFYVISHFSFCNGLTWNKNDLLDIGYGARFYKNDIIEYNLNYTQYYLSKKIKLYNKDFSYFLTDPFIRTLTKDDYVYIDPPYFGTKASYNKLWDAAKENQLLNGILKLHKNKIKFGLSNIYQNKHTTNEHLIKWAKENGFYIHYPNVTYNYGGNGDSESIEVFITNTANNYQSSLF